MPVVLQMKGEAEAFAVEAKAKAEAEQMEKKANAWKEYQDAAVVDMILDVLPKVCRPLSLLKLPRIAGFSFLFDNPSNTISSWNKYTLA